MLSGSLMVEKYGVSLLRMLNDILILDQFQWLPNQSDFSLIYFTYLCWCHSDSALVLLYFTLIPSSSFTEWRMVTMEHCMVWHASRERLPFPETRFRPFLGLANAPIVKTTFPELAVSVPDFSPEYTSVLSRLYLLIQDVACIQSVSAFIDKFQF